MKDIPAWVQQARDKWHYRGQTRPPFAAPVAEGQESVWDYPRPPRIEPVSRELLVMCKDNLIARSTRATRVLETASPPTFYLPPRDVRVEMLRRTDRFSRCEWKGQARYWSIDLPEGESLANVAWTYDEPFQGFERIAGHFSFYPAIVDCFVDGQRVTPQPGGIYGGWVTPELVGPFKGAPGTESW